MSPVIFRPQHAPTACRISTPQPPMAPKLPPDWIEREREQARSAARALAFALLWSLLFIVGLAAALISIALS